MAHDQKEKDCFLEPLKDHDIHVWYADIPGSQSIIQYYAGLLSPEEKKRVRRFKFDRDRNRYMFMHGVLRELLGKYIGIPPVEIIITKSKFGKPQVKISSSDHAIGLNMASSHGRVVLAFAYSRNIGVDVEYVDPGMRIEDITPSLFTPDEAERFGHVDDSGRIRYVLNLWTSKEAYVKAKGVGMHEPFEDISFNTSPNGIPSLEWALHDHDISRWTVSRLRPDDDYVGALVFDGPDAEIVNKTWSAGHDGIDV